MRRWSDAPSFSGRAAPFLRTAEAENNLLLGVLGQLERDPSVFDPPIYLATAEADGEVVGCAFRTPPYKLSLTTMPPEAVDALADDLAEVYPSLTIVHGRAEVATRFGERWAELRGVSARPGRRERIYRADAVEPPARKPAGRARIATLDDLPAVESLQRGFEDEFGFPRSRKSPVPGRLAQGAYWIWEHDGRACALAGWPARTERWARIGYVYTPPELRRRGFATALVAELTAYLLGQGLYVVLYTDLSNPTSNSIYQGIGYRPLVDLLDVDFGDRPTT